MSDMKGRPPKSTLQRTTEGTGHHPILEGVAVVPGVPDMPDGLPPTAQAEWNRVTPLLRQHGLVSQFDRIALADYCLCVARLDEAEADITQRGMLIKGEKGMVKNPCLQAAREYRQALRTWAEAFGFTPGSRGRININNVPVDDDTGGLLD